MLKKILDDMSSLLLAVLICFSLVYAMTSSLGLNIPVYVIILASAVLLAFYKVIFFSRLSMLISGLIAFIVLIFLIMQISFNIGLPPAFGFIYDYFIWLSDLILYGTYSDILYSNITLLSLCILTSAYYFAFSYKKYLFLVIIIPGAVTFSVQSIFNFAVTFLPFYVFLVAMILFYLKHIHYRKLKSPGNDYLGNASFLLWIIPIAFLVVFAASFIHTSDKPLEWKWLDTKVNAAYNYFYDKFDYVEFDYFSVADSGFGDNNSALGGRVRLNNTLVLTVETDRNVYLKGTAYDQYTGRNWVNTGEEYMLDIQRVTTTNLDAEETTGMYLLSKDINFIDVLFDREKVNMAYQIELFDLEKVKVVYQNIKTKSIFLSSKTIQFNPTNQNLKTLTNPLDNTFVSAKRLDSGFTYDFEYLMPKMSSEDFQEILRKSKKGLYKEFIAENNLTSNQLLSLLERNSSNVYDIYIRIPDTVPQRVFDLASSLTIQYDNNYDKVKALEEYLSTNFPYNLDVRSTPRNRDFVDYFLFDQKEGYCTYFASALTIMARCIGIPARYVEGYIMPPKASEKQSNLYYVTNNQAHAWTEVYFEGYGWLPFEATSPFRSDFYSNPEDSALYSSDLATNPAYFDYMEMMRDYSDGMNTSFLELGDFETKKTPYLLYTSFVAGAIILLLLSLLLFNSIRTKVKIYKIMNMTPKESVLMLYKYFVSVLTYSGYGIQAGETPLQYCERIDRYMYFRPVKFKDITDIFIKSRYSTDNITDKEKQIVMDFIPKLFDESKNNIGKTKYFIFRKALGKF